MSKDTSETIDYTRESEELFLNYLVSSPSCFVRCHNILKSDYWTERLRPAARTILNHYQKHNVVPTVDIIHAVTGVKLKTIESSQIQEAWFLDTIQAFCRHKAMAQLILDGPELLTKGRYPEIERRSKEINLISLQKDLGTDYFSDPLKRLMKMKDRTDMRSTGWRDLDDKLYGGFNRGEISIFIGGPGCVTADTIVEVIKLDGLNNHPYKTKIIELQDVKNGGKYLVSSPDGFVPVVDFVAKPRKITFEIKMHSGRVVQASYDHLFQKKNEEWIRTLDIQEGDLLITEDGIDFVERKKRLPKKYVYDLSVDHENHRYYTNGISSHNTGKSLFLQNIALNWVQQGLNVVYITLELSEDLIGLRYDAMITQIQTKEIVKNSEDAALKWKMITKSKSWGKLQIKAMQGAGATFNDVKAYIKEYEIQTGVKVDALAVDYLDLVYPNVGSISLSDLFVKDKFTSEELRALASELNVLAVTAAQINRCLAVDTKVVANGNTIELQNVKIGDWLDSNCGQVQVVAKTMPTTQKRFRIRTKSGKEIICSGNHQFPTKFGNLSINEGLKIGDSVLIRGDYIK